MLADPNNPLNNPDFGTGAMLQKDYYGADPSTRLQDVAGVAGPLAGVAGAAIGARGQNKAPAGAGFGGRGGFNMGSSLSNVRPYWRR
jgi:hypothetical protein